MTDDELFKLIKSVDPMAVRIPPGIRAIADALLATRVSSTPAATWRESGEPDPHGNYYDGERAALTLGKLSDDELANGVFTNADQPLDIKRIVAGDPEYHSPIVWLTAAKERIRWLSRALVKAQAAQTKQEPQ